MEVRLKPFNFTQAAERAGMADVARRVQSQQTPSPGVSFSQTLGQALKSVSQSQLEASRLQREVALDNPSVSIEQTMVAMQKSQIGFQAALQVRNRLVQAYSDIMNMQV